MGAKKSLGVRVTLQEPGIGMVKAEQKKRKDKGLPKVGKSRAINILLSELNRIKIAHPPSVQI